MIVCVTANPCLDKTLTVPAWQPGDQVRGTSVHEVVGGKGNNVARALVRLGRQARPATFLGGFVGRVCETLLRHDDGFDPLIVPVESATRVILTVRGPDGAASAFFDPDPAITPDETARFQAQLDSTLGEPGVSALTLSGSSPSHATHGLYAELVAMARRHRVPVFVDTYGPSLAALGSVWPDAIQLNRREAGIHLGLANPTDDDLMGLLSRWSKRGVRAAIVTDGPNPVQARIDGRIFHALPPQVEAVNPIGSGDCLMAGLVDAWLAGLDPASLLRRAVASAVANALVWDAGAIDPDSVRRLESEITIKPGPELS